MVARDAADDARTDAIANAAAAAVSATAASGSASTASGAATTATQKADEAGQKATIATAQVTIATTKAGEASTSATNAATSEASALGYKNAAYSSQQVAATAAGNAADSASAAASSASSAATSKTGADSSAAAAQTSATNASTSAGNASTSATAASTSATNAAGSATAASISQGAAATSATNAAGSASAAAGSASTAATKATDAGTSATAANQAKVDAQAAKGDAQSASSAAQGYAASASGSASAAASSAALSASVAGGSINKNAIFADFADAATLPGNWSSWAGTGARRFGNGDTVSDGTSVEGSPWSFYQDTGGGANTAGIYQNTPGGPGSYVVSASFELRSGTGLAGAGVLLYGLDGSGAMVAQGFLRFDADKDINGSVWNGTLTPGSKVYRFTKLIRLNEPRVVTIRVYAMTGWAQYSAITPKGLSWLRCGYRAASDGEIAAGQAATDAAAALAATATEQSVRASETGALATSVSTTNVRVGNVEARTTITETSIGDLLGTVAARLKLQALAGTGRAELVLWADANGGAGVDIVGDVRFKGLNIQDTGTVMLVQGLTNGAGFGTSNQFVYWYGPSKAINLCDEASALEYRKMNGDAYISGALLVGTLTTRAGTSDLSSLAVAETARFGSNGRTITVTLSYAGSAFSNTQVTSNAAFNSAVADVGATSADGTYYTAGGNDPGGWSVDLYRSVNGGAYVKVTTLSGGGAWSWNGSRPGPPGEPGNIVYFDNQGGSLTYTDPQNIAQDRQYKAVLASRNPKFALTLQNISIVCTEQ